MKAAVLVSNQNIIMKDIIMNETPVANNCRIKIHYVGICSSDIFRGFANGAYLYPLIMGHELSGVVDAIGPDVTKFKKGERVAVFPLLPCFLCESCIKESYQQCNNYGYYGSRQDGAYSEYLEVNEWNLLSVPTHISLADAAAVEPLAVVIHAIKRSNLFAQKKPVSIAILGAGFLGLLMAQVLHKKLPKCKVTLFDRNQFKLNIGQKFAHEICHYTDETSLQTLLQQKNSQFQTVIEATRAPSSFQASIHLASGNGKIIWMGNITDNLHLSKSEVSAILRKELTLIGTWNSQYHPTKSDDWKDALTLIEEGIRPSQLITQWIALDDVPNTLTRLYEHKIGGTKYENIKVMIDNTGSEI